MTEARVDWRTETERLLRAQDWTAAIAVIRPRLQQAPADAQAWVFLGEALERTHDVGSAWACYDRGWILDPPAAWIGPVRERLQEARTVPITDWVQKLLTVPPVRVVGAVIARNEAENIGRCLAALRPAVDAMVVVDTGSTDDTVAVAREAGAQVVEIEWPNDFGLARQAAEPLLGDEGWVLWVDADEFLDPEDISVPRIAAGLYDTWDPPMLLRFVQVNYIGDKAEPNYDTTRLFPLGRGLTWKGRIHEQVVFRDGPQPLQRGSVRVRVNHWGYEREVMTSRAKYERNIALLKTWTADEPGSAAAWGFLGRDLFISGRIEEAVEALYRAEMVAGQDRGYGRTVEVRTVLCEALVRLNRLEEARVVADRAVLGDPDHPAGWYWQAHIALLQADARLKVAVESARNAQEVGPRYRGIVTAKPDVVEFLAPITEADALKMQGRWQEAIAVYRRALQVKPNHAGVTKQLENIVKHAAEVAEANLESQGDAQSSG